MPDVHLSLHNLEIVRQIGLNLASHSFAGPLPETVELAVHDWGIIGDWNQPMEEQSRALYSVQCQQ